MTGLKSIRFHKLCGRGNAVFWTNQDQKCRGNSDSLISAPADSIIAGVIGQGKDVSGHDCSGSNGDTAVLGVQGESLFALSQAFFGFWGEGGYFFRRMRGTA